MAIQGFAAKKGNGGEEFVDAVLPEDSYQCVIEKAELREGTKYMSTETEMQLLFYIRPINLDPAFKNKLLFYQTTTSFFNGKSTSAKAGLKASKLYTFIKTVYKFYKPEVKVEDMQPEEITDEVINFLEGKQIMAIVKVTETGKNKISDIMSIKEEVTVVEPKKGAAKVADADAELDELLNT